MEIEMEEEQLVRPQTNLAYNPPGYTPYTPSPFTPPGPPPNIYQTPDPTSPDAWNYGFNRDVSIFQSPPYGAGFLALALFFLAVFSSNILLVQINLATLGITVTLATLGLAAIVILILFLL